MINETTLIAIDDVVERNLYAFEGSGDYNRQKAKDLERSIKRFCNENSGSGEYWQINGQRHG